MYGPDCEPLNDSIATKTSTATAETFVKLALSESPEKPESFPATQVRGLPHPPESIRLIDGSQALVGTTVATSFCPAGTVTR